MKDGQTTGSSSSNSMKGFRFREDFAIADAAIEVWGQTREDIFTVAAEATLAVMADQRHPVAPDRRISVDLSADSLDLLLVRFLDEILYLKDTDGRFAIVASITVDEGESCRLTAELELKPICDAYELHVDVKAVTLYRLAVEQTDNGWRATFVLDV